MNWRLKGKALKWVQTKPNYLVLSATQLLEEMKLVFDHRPSKLALRREMEIRTWNKNETFYDYYLEKMILANRINVDPEELVDLLIDGIPDIRLRDQARMNCYKSAEELLRAFKKIALEENTSFDRKRAATSRHSTRDGIIATSRQSTRDEITATSRQSIRDEITNKEFRCYNCNTTGHLKKNCPKPLRTWGSCYRCGSTQHRANNCSLNAASTSRAAGTTTLNLIQPNSPRDAFEVTISWEVSGGKYGNQQVNLTGMLDSGSPN
ncbi:uncharacterized protein LOC143266635 [Megachile rotundata]|uniref:uncharacterized protein LOC143266635 n=1 Tax=Megachile rotundata TaxID=143995 RepID=UPI003FCF976E